MPSPPQIEGFSIWLGARRENKAKWVEGPEVVQVRGADRWPQTPTEGLTMPGGREQASAARPPAGDRP